MATPGHWNLRPTRPICPVAQDYGQDLFVHDVLKSTPLYRISRAHVSPARVPDSSPDGSTIQTELYPVYNGNHINGLKFLFLCARVSGGQTHRDRGLLLVTTKPPRIKWRIKCPSLTWRAGEGRKHGDVRYIHEKQFVSKSCTESCPCARSAGRSTLPPQTLM
ncbi:hypothetical protein Bbelb_423770 [Branchiostoma belcheri]|nr:hypothetical protein Bbelb_423770 [Branchiostoma belcheri]